MEAEPEPSKKSPLARHNSALSPPGLAIRIPPTLIHAMKPDRGGKTKIEDQKQEKAILLLRHTHIHTPAIRAPSAFVGLEYPKSEVTNMFVLPNASNDDTRYTDIIAMDSTMVSIPNSSYINANWVRDSPDCPRYTPQPFIMAQAPTLETIGDFYTLLFTHNVSVVVCLTPLMECGRVKANRYWPSAKGESFSIAAYLVTLEEEESLYQGAIIRRAIRVATRPADASRTSANGCICAPKSGNNASLSSSSDSDAHLAGYETMTFTMFHYTKWSDQASPSCLDTFAELIRNVRSLADVDRTRPVLAHCSAGVGRAGTFVASYNLILLAELYNNAGSNPSSPASHSLSESEPNHTAFLPQTSSNAGSSYCLSSEETLSTSSASSASSSSSSPSSSRVSVREMVDWIRHQRHGAVQTVSQYKFIPKIVALFEEASSSEHSLSDSNEEEMDWMRACQYGSSLRVQ